MIVIFGGAYQGKLDYAKEKFNICDNDVFTCTDNQAAIDTTARVIYGLENFTFACVKAGLEEYYEARGWDPETGIPRRSTLEKMGLKYVADEMEQKYGMTLAQ